MAKILLSFFTPSLKYGIPAFYDGLMQSFIECGNEVKYILSNNFVQSGWNGSNELKKDVNKDNLVSIVKKYSPDLCIAFNNSIPRDVTENIDCPIILWHGDTFAYFNDKENIKKNKDRYYYLCPFDRDVEAVRNALNVKNEKILKIIPASAVKKDDSFFTQNISFIGSMFRSTDVNDALRKIHNPTRLIKIANAVAQNPLVEFVELLEKENCSDIKDILTKENFIDFVSVQNRNQTLCNLYDLGLKIYGKGDYFNWLDLNTILPFLAMCYDDKNVFSLKENQDIYNSSKISINISHAQAREGFPWRVFDIMASNSCLVSDRRAGLVEFTKDYVEIPMYYDAHEARQICEKLLKDEKWRKEIVIGSQKCIEEKGRWSHRFKEIQEAVKVNLINEVATAKAGLFDIFAKNEPNEIKPQKSSYFKLFN